MSRTRRRLKSSLMSINLHWILLLMFMFCMGVKGEDEYYQCITVQNEGELESNTLCVNATFYSDCDVKIRVRSGTMVILKGRLNLELSRKICTTDQICALCLEFTDFHVDPLLPSPQEEDEGEGEGEEGSHAEGCITLYSFCLSPSMRTSFDFGCFDFPNSSLSHCTDCPAKCGGEEHGECDNGRCECKEGWGDPLCLTSLQSSPSPPSPSSQCLSLGPPFNSSACSVVTFSDCFAEVNITVGESTILNYTVPLLPSSDVSNSSLCQSLNPSLPPIFGNLECEVCIGMGNITEYYSEEAGENEIRGCLAISTSRDCFLNNFISLSDLSLGCFSAPSSLCGGCNDNCTGNGECVEGICSCFPGWSGFACALPICEGECSGRGECVGPGRCECEEGYSGERCERTCEEEGTRGGIKLLSKQWYTQPLSSLSPWRAWADLSSLSSRFDLYFFVNSSFSLSSSSSSSSSISSTSSSSSDPSYNDDDEGDEGIEWEIRLVYRKDCPPTEDQYDDVYSFPLSPRNEGGEVRVVVEEVAMNFLKDCLSPADYLAHFALYLLPSRPSSSVASLFFSLNAWKSVVRELDGGKVIGETLYPHLSYYSYTSFPLSQLILSIKVKNETRKGYEGEMMEVYIQKDSCPSFPFLPDPSSPSYLLSSPLHTDSPIYPLLYTISLTNTDVNATSTWYFYLLSRVTCDNYPLYFLGDDVVDDDDNGDDDGGDHPAPSNEEERVIEQCGYPLEVQYSIEIKEIFQCSPPCENGGQCSQIFPNLCLCPDGFTGRSCHLFNCAPACGPHGVCDGPNHCLCEEGWGGELCIDIERTLPDIPLARVKSGHGWLYLSAFISISFLVLFAAFLIYFKQHPSVYRFLKRQLLKPFS